MLFIFFPSLSLFLSNLKTGMERKVHHEKKMERKVQHEKKNGKKKEKKWKEGFRFGVYLSRGNAAAAAAYLHFF